MSQNLENIHITTHKHRFDMNLIHAFLSEESYWARNITLEKVQKAIENSLCFGLFDGDKQIGFARVISDFSTIAYLGDVFVLKAYRGQGLGKMLMDAVHAHRDLQGLRRWILLTSDAHKLYEQYDWKSIAAPEKWMEKFDPEYYLK